MKVKIGPYRIKKGQKVNIHIDKWDTWGMDHTLAHIIVPMLKQLKATKHGIPSEFVTDDSKEAFAAGEKVWNFILDKMIWSFEQIINDDNESAFFDPFNANAFYAYNEHIQNGINLFGKYYRSLWD